MTPLEKALAREKEGRPDNCMDCKKFRVVGTGWYCAVSGKLLLPTFASVVCCCGPEKRWNT